MNSRKNIVMIAVLVLVTLLLTTAWNVFAGNNTIIAPGKVYEESIHYGSDLEWSPIGSWIVRISGAPFIFWRTITPQDLTGNRYGGTVAVITSRITEIDPETTLKDSVMLSQTVRTGPNNFETIDIMYGTKEESGNMFWQVSLIWISHTEWTLTGPDTYEGGTKLMTYRGDQDADGDGFPDEGQQPIEVVEYPVVGKRLRVMPR